MRCAAAPPQPRRPESLPRTSRAAASAVAAMRSLASRTAARQHTRVSAPYGPLLNWHVESARSLERGVCLQRPLLALD